MQVCDETCSSAQAGRKLHRHPEGGLLEDAKEPPQGLEARHQEVVLHPNQGVWTATPATKVTTTKVFTSQFVFSTIAIRPL